jgi:hypothetical protein
MRIIPPMRRETVAPDDSPTATLVDATTRWPTTASTVIRPGPASGGFACHVPGPTRRIRSWYVNSGVLSVNEGAGPGPVTTTVSVPGTLGCAGRTESVQAAAEATAAASTSATSAATDEAAQDAPRYREPRLRPCFMITRYRPPDPVSRGDGPSIMATRSCASLVSSWDERFCTGSVGSRAVGTASRCNIGSYEA